MSKIHEIKAVWCLSFRAGFLGNSNSRIPYRTEGAGMVLPQVAPGVFAFCAVASFFQCVIHESALWDPRVLYNEAPYHTVFKS